MQLVFEGVSYAYTSPTQGKKKRRKADKANAGAGTNNATKPADWGSDPANPYALQNVSFTLEEGDFLGICGHTGSGKSTLIQHMNGLLQPTQGRVLLDGQDLADKKVQRTCRGLVGVVFQYPEHQLFANTVIDDVAFGPRNLGLSAEEVDQRVHEALTEVGLDYDKHGSMSPFELSGGQQRRAAFAGVLAMKPQILVLDEPAAGLDPASRASFLGLIQSLHQRGLTVVMVSHSMEDLASLCDKLLVLNRGTVFAQGTPDEVFADAAALHAIGLDVPAAQRVANALRADGIALPDHLFVDAESLAQAIGEAYAKRTADTQPEQKA